MDEVDIVPPMRRFSSLFALALVACDAPAPPGDADVDGSVEVPLASPMAPLSPRFICPPGWREAMLHDTAICEPWTSDAAPSCADDEVAVPGEGCVPVQPCPSGPWPEGLPPNAVYALAGATGGDGTEARPFGTVTGALTAAMGRPGSVVALGAGEFVETVVLRSGYPPIVGLCPARSRIREAETASPAGAAVVVASGDGYVTGVHLSGPLHGLWVTPNARGHVEGVVIEGPGVPVRISRTGTLEGLRVRVIARGAEFGVETWPEASLTLRRSTLTGGGGGIKGTRLLSDPNEVHGVVVLEDSAILDTVDGLSGRIDSTLTRVAIERVQRGAIVVGPRTTSLTDVRGRRGSSAFLTLGGGEATLSRVSVSDVVGGPAFIAITAEDEMGMPYRGSLSGADVFLSDVLFDAALSAFAADISLVRVRIANVAGAAITIQEGTGVFSDLRISGTQRVEGQGASVGAFKNSTLSIDRVDIRPVSGAALVVDERSVGTVTSLEVVGGEGVQAQCSDPCPGPGTQLTLTRARISGVIGRGLTAFGVVDIAVDGLTIDGVLPGGTTDWVGTGLVAVVGGTIHGTGVRVREVQGVGVLALRTGRIDLTDVEVSNTHPYVCEGCIPVYGDAILCALDATLALRDFDLHDASRAGLAFGQVCLEATLSDGAIHDNGVGVLSDGPPPDASGFSNVSNYANLRSNDSSDLTFDLVNLGLE